MDLALRWPLLAAPEQRDRLVRAYAAGDRGYHDTRHLTEVLDRIDELRDTSGFEPLPVRLAAWFHDAVYDRRPGAEERSAERAEEELTGLGLPSALVTEVARLVRLTEDHQPDADDANGCALVDADLAILASPEGRYAEYVADVRREYAHVADAAFRTGRARVLGRLADQPRIFRTPHAVRQWEQLARANLDRELTRLRESP
ncbi:MAG: HD domain-containing protein [Nocardioides sp.]